MVYGSSFSFILFSHFVVLLKATTPLGSIFDDLLVSHDLSIFFLSANFLFEKRLLYSYLKDNISCGIEEKNGKIYLDTIRRMKLLPIFHG